MLQARCQIMSGVSSLAASASASFDHREIHASLLTFYFTMRFPLLKVSCALVHVGYIFERCHMKFRFECASPNLQLGQKDSKARNTSSSD